MATSLTVRVKESSGSASHAAPHNRIVFTLTCLLIAPDLALRLQMRLALSPSLSPPTNTRPAFYFYNTTLGFAWCARCYLDCECMRVHREV